MLQAKLVPSGGVPAIEINGTIREPQMLYIHTSADPDYRERALRQVRLAAKSGVHMFTCHCTMDCDLIKPIEETNLFLKEFLRDIVRNDPEALIMPRCSFFTAISENHVPYNESTCFSDGRGMESERSSFEEYAADPTCIQREGQRNPIASHFGNYWRNIALLTLTRFIRAIRMDEVLREHVFCYHLAAGMSSELYQYRYWSGILDTSEGNRLGFARWLRQKYGSDDALSSAWEGAYSLTGVQIPVDLPGISLAFKEEYWQKARTDRRIFDTLEWFTWRNWDAMLDFPDAEEYSLRVYLDAIYKNDDALSQAWGQKVSLQDNLVPEDFHSWFKDFRYDALLSGKGWKRWSDYMDYIGDQVASLVEEAAATIKRETEGNALTCFFYAYHYDVPSAQSGHHSTARVLACPDVDILCAPLSYYNRNEGGMGASMSNITSIHNAGKLWLDESDYRQPVVTGIAKGLDVCKSIRTMAGAREIILRQCGRLALTGAANWWMDLRGLGWYDSEEIWNYISEGRKFQCRMENARRLKTADVVFLDDEKAMSFVGDAWRFSDDLMNKTRNELYYSGIEFDLCMLEDFLAGKLDGAKLYVFLNPFRLISSGKADAVKARLQKLGASALWIYGFGPEDTCEQIRDLTGFTFTRDSERAASVSYADIAFTRRPAASCFVPVSGEPLGTYSTGKTGAARTDACGYDSWFFGGTRAPAALLRVLAETLGIPLHTDGKDMFMLRGNLAVLHTVKGGIKHLRFSAPVTELRSGAAYGSDFCLETKAETTYLFISE